MTTQQENWIESKLKAYLEELQNKDVDYIENKVQGALEEAEEKERERLDDLNAQEKLSLHGAAYEAHIKKFLEDKEKELYDYFKAECDKENDRLVSEYRAKLESEAEE